MKNNSKYEMEIKKMDSFCRSCFNPLRIHSSGFLTIFSNDDENLETILIDLHFQKVKKNFYRISYDCKSTLKEYLSFIRSELINDLSVYTGSIHNTSNLSNFDIYSLETIYNHTFYENTIKVIKSGEFTSFLQPIVSIKNSELFGYESLLRVKDQSIFPSKLFEIARKTDMHSILDRKAREIAIKTRRNKIPPGIKSFINFLPSTIYNPEYCLKHTFAIVEKYDVNPNDLIFEVVETEKIHNVNHLKSIFTTYRSYGIKVALDDVGAGYSTLDMLAKLQPDYIKIDRQYIKDCHFNKDNQTFLKDILLLAKGLNITVLAEGIETKDEFDYLKHIGIDLAQGYYIGKPSPNPLAVWNDRNKLNVI